MSSESSSVNPESLESTKRQIRSLIQEIAALSKQNVPPEDYFREMLPKVVSALAAIGGAVWIYDEKRRPRLIYQVNLTRSLVDPEDADGIRHLRLIEEMFKGAPGQLLAPQSGSIEEGASGNPTNSLLVVAPIKNEEQEVEGVIEIFQRPDSQPASQRGYLRFLEQMCGLTTEWFKTRQLKDYSDRQSLWAKIEQFSRAVHENLDLRQTAYTIANEGRRLIGCDRVSVALRRGRRWKVEAVSGQDVFDARSNQITLLGGLTKTVMDTGEAFWFNGQTDDLSPQLETAVHDYVDESHTKTIAIIPLRRPEHATDANEKLEGEEEREFQGEILGALIVEQIEDSSNQAEFRKGVELISEHSCRALANAIDYNNIPLTPLWRLLAKSRLLVEARNLPKTVGVVVAVIAATLALCLIQVPFRLSGQATLTPIEKRDIFVREEGEVVDVPVSHGQFIETGQLVAKLRNRDLDMQYERLLGEQSKAEQSLRGLIHRRNFAKDDDEKRQLAIDLSLAEMEITKLTDQLALLAQKQQFLEVRSPIAGEIVSWDVRDSLMQRPVSPGQILMTVVDPNQEWVLEVKMPEKRLQHIVGAQQELGDELDVTYIMASNPGTQLEGKLVEIQRLAQADPDEGQIVRIKVAIDKEKLLAAMPQLRTGATATAKINCGTAPLGYTWLHEVWEFIQSRVLF